MLLFSARVTPKIHNALHAEHDKAKAEIERKDKKIISLNEKVEQLKVILLLSKSK